MEIYDVIKSLRKKDLEMALEILGMKATLHLVETYLSTVSDYPKPPLVSRETTEVTDRDAPTLF